MNKTVVDVPAGIRYISEWKEFCLLEYPHIIDKKIPGCGFTEYCLRNNQNLILVSPRKVLLANKEMQHKSFGNPIYYAHSGFIAETMVDKDLTMPPTPRKPGINGLIPPSPEQVKKRQEAINADFERIWGEITIHWNHCINNNIPCKILVTYDSFPKIKDIMTTGGIFQDFYVVVDEFQSIFTDSRFKSSTELKFVTALQGVSRLCYVSATPMIEKYLDRLDEFKDLPYFELDWAKLQPDRVSKPDLDIKPLISVVNSAKRIIEDKYKSGKFDTALRIDPQTGKQIIVESKEAVFYVNSVNNICKIVKNCGLKSDEVNILCADTVENQKKLRSKLGKAYTIGSVPLFGEPRKMFTFCTRTVYLGADFYSDNAKTYIISDANIDTMAVDITLDLPQILGRQRLRENPWKDKAEVFVKTVITGNQFAADEFRNLIKKKRISTQNLLDAYSDTRVSAKDTLAEKYEKDAKNSNYKDDYVAVDDGIPVENNLTLVSEERAFEVQQIDYKDRFSVFSSMESQFNVEVESKEANTFLQYLDSLKESYHKMKYICENLPQKSESLQLRIVNGLPESYRLYYTILTPEVCKSLSYNFSKMKERLDQLNNSKIIFDSSSLDVAVFAYFKPGDKYSKAEIKKMLQDIYDSVNYPGTAKALDLDKWYELKPCKVSNKETGKRDNGLEIVKKK